MNEDDLIDQILEVLQSILASGEELDEGLVDEISKILSDRLAEMQGQQPGLEPGAEPVDVPIPVGGDLLWILAGADPKAFVSYLTTMPDPALNALAQNPVQLKNVIERLSRQITMPAGESADGIPKQGLQSSNVYGFQYSPKDQILRVKFQGNGGDGQGPVYQYDGVPP